MPLEQVAFEAWAGHEGDRYLPLNLLVGKGVTLAGTVGHVKSVLDSMLRRGELNQTYGSAARKALTIVAPLARAGIATALLYTSFRLLAAVIPDSEGGPER